MLRLLALAISLEGGISLEWTAPQECPSSVEVEARLGRLLTSPPSEPLWARGQIQVRGGNHVLELDWWIGSRHEHERLVGSDCATLGRLAALLLASSIDPFAFAVAASQPPEAEQPSRPPETEQPSRPSEPELPPLTSAVEPAQLPRHDDAPGWESKPVLGHDVAPERRVVELAGFVSAEGQGSINLLAGPAGGPRLDLGLELARARVLVAGAGWFGAPFRSASDPELGGRLAAWSIELDPCGLPSWRRLSFPLCGQVGAGQVIGEGFGVDSARRAALPWVWLGANAGLEWWVRPRLALHLGLGVVFSLLRPGFEIVASDARFELAIVSGQARLGLAARFGDRRRESKTDRREPDRQERP